MGRRARRAGVLVAVAALVVAAGCGGSPNRRTTAPTAPATSVHNTGHADRTIDYTAADFSYTGPAETPPGSTRITMLNAGDEDHEMLVLRVPASVPDLQPGDALSDAYLGKPGAGDFVGAIHGVAPGEKGSTVVELKPGRYILGCTISSPSDLVTHFDKGMISVLTVP